MSKINKNAFRRIRPGCDVSDLLDDENDAIDEVMEDTYQRARRKGQPVLEDKVHFVRDFGKTGGVSRFRPRPVRGTDAMTEEDE